MLYEHYLLLDFKSCDSRNILTRVLVQLILILLHEHIQNINHFTFNPLLDNQFHVVRVWFCGCKKCIFNKLILLKIEFNVKWFMLIYIYVKMSWTINSNVKITFWLKNFKLESILKTRATDHVKINFTAPESNLTAPNIDFELIDFIDSRT